MAIIIDSKSKEQILRVVSDDHAIQTLPETSADQVTLEDKAGNYKSDNVEDALAEVMEVAQTGGVTGVKGSAEETYRKGNVEISPANLGITVVNNTADKDKRVAYADEAGKVTNELSISAHNGVNADKTVTFDGSADSVVDFDVNDFKYSNVDKGMKISLVDKGYATKTYVDTQDAKKFDKTGGTIDGDVVVTGDLTIKGTNTIVDTQTLEVKDNLIVVAKDNTTALTTPAGMLVPKYDGTNNVALVVDNDGMAKVGKVVLDSNGNINKSSSSLQTLATRTGLVNDNLVKYDETNKTLVDSGKKISDFATAEQGSTADAAKTKADANETTINKIIAGTQDVGKAKEVTEKINGHNISDIFQSDGITAKQATNATTSVGGRAISEIFEANGSTKVKQATLADTATSANKVANKLKVSGQNSAGLETQMEYDGSAAKEVSFDPTDFVGIEMSNGYAVELAPVYLDEQLTQTVEGTYTAVQVNSKGVVQAGGRSIAFIEANDDIPADVMIGGLVFRKKA